MHVAPEIQDFKAQEDRADPGNEVTNSGEASLFDSVQSVYANSARLVQNPVAFLEGVKGSLNTQDAGQRFFCWLIQEAQDTLSGTTETVSVTSAEMAAMALEKLSQEAASCGIPLNTAQMLEAAVGIMRIAQGTVLNTNFFPSTTGAAPKLNENLSADSGKEPPATVNSGAPYAVSESGFNKTKSGESISTPSYNSLNTEGPKVAEQTAVVRRFALKTVYSLATDFEPSPSLINLAAVTLSINQGATKSYSPAPASASLDRESRLALLNCDLAVVD